MLIIQGQFLLKVRPFIIGVFYGYTKIQTIPKFATYLQLASNKPGNTRWLTIRFRLIDTSLLGNQSRLLCIYSPLQDGQQSPCCITGLWHLGTGHVISAHISWPPIQKHFLHPSNQDSPSSMCRPSQDMHHLCPPGCIVGMIIVLVGSGSPIIKGYRMYGDIAKSILFSVFV